MRLWFIYTRFTKVVTKVPIDDIVWLYLNHARDSDHAVTYQSAKCQPLIFTKLQFHQHFDNLGLQRTYYIVRNVVYNLCW